MMLLYLLGGFLLFPLVVGVTSDLPHGSAFWGWMEGLMEGWMEGGQSGRRGLRVEPLFNEAESRKPSSGAG